MSNNNRINLRLTDNEQIEFERLFNSSDMNNKTAFVKSLIFNRSISIVKTDPNTQKYVQKLVGLQSEYKAIGNNYNQAVKALNSIFTEKKAIPFTYKLQEYTKELIRVNKQIIELTNKLWLQK